MKYLAIIFLLGVLVFPVVSQSTKSKPAAARPAPSATPKKPDEKTEWEKAAGVAQTAQRVSALKKFLEAFPKSTRQTEAAVLIATGEAALGNEKLAAEDIPAAVVLFRAAAADAPKPIPDQLFTDTLAKFAANLYFRGARVEAFEIAKTLEAKADASAVQLLGIADFYMSVENGAEAKRLANAALRLDANSFAAYQTLGLANRIDFQLDESAAAYAKAVELNPDSLIAKRGLAEMKRSLGRSDDAIALYREILAKDQANLPARTGLILALFDAEKRSEAEEELTRSLDAHPGNVILLAGAAYWYAAHNEGEKAVSLAQKAIAADPRFIWSHIAQARGFLSQDNTVAAERTLLAARRYGNFPTLEYELASVRLSAGYYREAAEELARSFSVKDGLVHTNLGGRVSRESKYFTELVGYERRASIFAPTAADSPESAARLAALLELKQELDTAAPRPEVVSKAADEFVKGGDKMIVHRQIFTAIQLLEKKIALPKVVELAKAAARNVDAGLDVPQPAIPVMAAELYESRAIAASRGQYINVPDVPRPQLSAILRGQIEELSGWATFQMDEPAEATLRLKRAVSVLPVDSVWWRSSTWRLASVLALSGKDAEALDMYIKSYKSSGPSPIRYDVIEALYKRVNGSTDGLEARIGPNPAPPSAAETTAQKVETADQKPEATPTPAATVEPVPAPVVKEEPKPAEIPAAVPVATPAVITDQPKAEGKPAEIPAIVPVATPPVITDQPKAEGKPAEIPAAVPVATPPVITDQPKTEPKTEPAATAVTTETKPVTVPEASPTPTPEVTTEPTPGKTPAEPPRSSLAEVKPTAKPRELFPPVIITIPAPDSRKIAGREPEAKGEPSPTPVETKVIEDPKPAGTPVGIKPPEEQTATPVPSPDPTPAPTPTSTPEKKPDDDRPAGDGRPRITEGRSEPAADIKPCLVTVSEESINLQTGGGDLAVIVGRADDGDVEGVTAVSSSPQDVNVRREIITGVKARALFVVRATGAKPGLFQVRFEMPCGKKDIVVKVR